jgi:hypothetical protein
MNKNLQIIFDIVQQSEAFNEEPRSSVIKALKDADKELEITAFKLERTEKVKKTTAILLEETIEELEQKRKAVEAQNRELEIEKSLEKVRTVAMAMRKPDDMLEVCKTISLQLEFLGVAEIRNVQTAIFYQERGSYTNYEYYSKHYKTFITETTYTNNELHQEFAEKMIKGKGEFFITHIKGKEVIDWIAYQKTTNVFIDYYLETASSLNYYWFSLGPVALGISTYQPLTEDEINLFKRFLKVFELSYQRYLDIENAESQAREAEIQLALERVRARAMAMQKSTELADLVATLFDQLKRLDFALTRCYIYIIDPDSLSTRAWTANMESGGLPKSYYLPYIDAPYYKEMINAWKERKQKLVYELGGDEKIKTDKILFNETEYKLLPENVKSGMMSVDRVFLSFSLNNYGALQTGGLEPLSEENLEILSRFGKVFDQNYTRLLDLKKAEAQAREAQIQLALERVRARTMAMQSSDELAEVSYLLNKQVVELGVPTRGCAFNIYNEHDSTEWFSSLEGTIPTYKTPRENIFLKYYEVGQSGETLFIEEYGSERIKEHYKYLATLSVSGGTDTTIKENVQVIPEYQIDHVAYFKYGYLLFITLVPAPEAHDVFIRFSKEFEQTYTRFLDLKKAEAQAREARIEAALERVRSRSMAMRSSSEISILIYHLYGELSKLDAQLDRCFIMIVNPENRGINWWLAGKEGLLNENGFFVQNNQHPSHQLYLNYWEERRKKWTYLFEGKEKEEWDRFGFSQTELTNLPEPVKKDMSGVNKIYLSGSSDIFGCLVTGSFEPLSDEHQGIISRFASVFNQTYTRFLDLQKAEAQAREAQIEASLERVRAHAMGLRDSGELQKIITIIFEELNKLGISLSESSIFIVKDNTRDFTCWTSSESAQLAESYSFPYFNHPILEKLWMDIKNKVSFREFIIESEELLEFSDMLFTLTDFKFAPDEYKNSFRSLNRVYVVQAMMKHGFLEVFGNEQLPDKFADVLKRFTNVVDLTYTRFLDLQKAEARAREAQIEAALERVRSRTMGMQRSDELKEAAVLLFQQLVSLGVPAFGTGFNIWDDDRKFATAWMGGHDRMQPPFKTSTSEDIFLRIYKTAERGESLFVEEQGGEALNIHYKYMNSIPAFKEIADKMAAVGQTFPAFQIMHCAFFSQGYLMFITFEPVPDAYEIFKRFAKVFEQTYTRFLDLQKAEKQAREAQIELSLERIRAQVTAMKESSDLLDIVVTMRNEFVALGHEAHYFWHMRYLPEKYEKAMTSGDGTRIGMVMELPRHIHGEIKLLADWEKSDEPTVVYAMDVDTALEYVDKMINLGDFKLVDPNAPTHDDIRHIGGLTFVMARTTHGEIGYSLPGIVTNPPAEDLNTLVRFSGVFDLAYKRFEDLKASERQHREAQIELSLERTRTQSMLMKHSSELNDISKTFHEQLLSLGIDSEFSFVWLPDEDKHEHMFWATWVNEINGTTQYQSKSVKYPLNKTEPGTAKCYSDWESSQPVHETFVPPGQIDSFFASWEELLKGAVKFKPEFFPEGIYYTEAYMKYGCFGIDIRRPITQEEKEILRKFSVEFERTYTRFLDLQKAEEQNKIIQAENERKTKELEDARQLQLAMLPRELPKLPNIEIAVYMKTATEVGGDYYDYHVHPDGTLTVILGDATGHGMMSGMMVSVMKSFFIADRSEIELKRFFENSNASIKDMQLGRLMMALIGVQITPEKIIAANAGMPSLFYFRNKSQKAGEFILNNMPLGAMKGTKYSLKQIRHEKGDTLLLMSDGFAELKNENNEIYGYQRALEEFKKVVKQKPEEIIDHLKDEGKRWTNDKELEDDVTFVVIKVK